MMGDFGARRLGGERFTCVICHKDANKDWWSKDGMRPICSWCEQHQTPVPKPHGSFRDRRINRQIFAVSQAIETEARHQFYKENGYGFAGL